MIKIRPQKYSPYTQRVNGTIASAIDMYEKKGVPLRQLITDFNLVLSNSEEFRIWCDYHYGVCREESTLGASNHVVIVGKK